MVKPPVKNHSAAGVLRGRDRGPAPGLNNRMNPSGMLLGAVEMIVTVSISQERENQNYSQT